MNNTLKSRWIVDALETHERPLIRYATWILGDLEAAREVVQETFFRLCKEEPEHIGGYLAQWLFTVCRNLALDTRKKEARMAPLGEVETSIAASLDRQHDEKQALSQILEFIEALPKNQREVIYLKFQCDLSYKEISEITKLSVSNVGFLIHTAVRTIRKQMLSETTAQRRTQ